MNKLPWFVNGQVRIGDKIGYRIDSSDDENVGLKMLLNPIAIVFDLDDAHKIVNAVNVDVD